MTAGGTKDGFYVEIGKNAGSMYQRWLPHFSNAQNQLLRFITGPLSDKVATSGYLSAEMLKLPALSYTWPPHRDELDVRYRKQELRFIHGTLRQLGASKMLVQRSVSRVLASKEKCSHFIAIWMLSLNARDLRGA